MASGFTTSTSVAELVPEITEQVDYIFQNQSLGRALVTVKDVSSIPGKIVEFPEFTEVAASTAANETSTPDSHAMDLSMPYLTIAKRAVLVQLGDLANKSMSASAADIGYAMGMAMVKAIDTSIFGVITTTNYSTSAGATNAVLSFTHCLNALNKLEINEVDTLINLVVHPLQYATVRANLLPVAASTGTVDIKIPNPVSDAVALRGVSNAVGMNWYVSARVGTRTVDATASCYSGLVFSPKGIGFAFAWLYTPGIEVIRGTEAVSNMILNWGDSAGVIKAAGVCTLYSSTS